MSLLTYSDLKTAVSGWVKRSDLSGYLDDLVTIGEKWIYRHARTREMETSLSVVISAGVAAIPSDFIELKNARVASPAYKLEVRPADWIYDQYPDRTGGGVPAFIGVEGSDFVFGPYPNGQTVTGTYYRTLGAVSSSAHALFLANPDLYLFATLAEAVIFMKDDARVQLWSAKRDLILQDVNLQAQASRYGQGLAVRVA